METQLTAIQRLAKTRPNDVWITQPMGNGVIKELTFSEAIDEAQRMASYLRSLDIPDNSQIALFSKNCAWWLLADLAIWMAGHVSVPLYPTLTPESIGQILDHSESRFVFIGKLDGWEGMKDGIPDSLPKATLPLHPDGLDGVDTWYDLIKDQEPAEIPDRDPDEMATIVYTSGSTGTPKGVMHSFRTMCAGTEFLKVADLRPDDRILSYLPLAHVLERLLVGTLSMIVGYRLYFAESLDTFVQDLQRARPTVFVSVPRLWQRFQLGVFSKMPPEKLNRLLKIPIVHNIVCNKLLNGLGLQDVRIALSGSAPIPAPLLAWYKTLGLEILEGYGMSENFCLSHINQPREAAFGTVGPAHEAVQCRISEEGEIQVKGPCDMLGYYKAPELTEELFTEDRFIRTGDRGEVDAAGRLRITGRTKELFKTSKGKYVAPAPIENKILTHENVELACVTGSGMPQPFGLVMLSEDARKKVGDSANDPVLSSLRELRDRLNSELDHHERLATIVAVKDEWTVENGMLTPTMKLKRAALEDRYGSLVEDWYSTKEPVILHG
jgi:long-subunit acyl-CoA synthetase (AMP-forming)